jgi:2-polyprenyl-3-methyl-5-hydroxy-6-metoxy-1,4-benzoquinol methylase
MPDNHYENSKLAEIYDLDSGWSIDRDFYLKLAGDTPQSILDLGCGTGLLCNAYAQRNHVVTGVDPSEAMLDVARRKPHGKEIEWVQSSAQDYSSNKRFDLIIMTGHAFQVLLEDNDVIATFSTMRKHLKHDGKIVFESRNPDIDWSHQWSYKLDIELPDSTAVTESRKFIAMKNARMIFELHYQFPDQSLVSESELRFYSKGEIEQFAVSADLRVDNLFGDWQEESFNSKSSLEMIFLLRHST